MTETAGARPLLPVILNEWPALVGTMPAVRLAALRIAAGLTFLVDLVWTYLPHAATLFGPGGLSPASLFEERFHAPHANGSLLRILPDTWGPTALILAGVVASLVLVSGRWARPAAIVCWVVALSLLHANFFLWNSGDLVRSVLLILVIVAPVDAAGVIGRPAQARTVYRWPATLILVQLSCIYFFSGVYKLMAPAWRDGTVMDNVLRDGNWSLISAWADSLPPAALLLTTWITLGWELLFPLAILWRPTRVAALLLGAVFHVGTAFTLEVGLFPWYALCLYVPFVPWERFAGSRVAASMASTSSAS